MHRNSLRKTSLESMEAEIESLLKSLEHLKHDASEESQKSVKAIRSNAESALRHSRSLLSDAYEEVKQRTRQTGIATRDYAQEHPYTTAGVAIGALTLGAEGEAVDIAAIPAGNVPGQRAAFIGVLPFQLIGKEQKIAAALVHRMRRQVGKCRGAVSIADRRNWRARLLSGANAGDRWVSH